MGRQKEFDQEEALIKARNLFWDKGYEKTSLNDLLDVMGIHKKSFYDTFGSKKEIFIDALKNYHDEIYSVTLSKVNEESTSRGKIRKVFEASLNSDGGTHRGCMIINTIADSYENDPEIYKLTTGWIEEIKESFLSFLVEDKGKGWVAESADPAAEAERLTNAFIGFRLQLKMHKSQEDLTRLIDLIAQKQHVILLDLPGVGASEGKVPNTISAMAQEVISTVKTLGYKKINLLGLSMGGMIAQEVIRTDQSVVNKLVLVGTGPRSGIDIDKVTGVTFRHMGHSLLHGEDMKRYIFYTPDSQGREVAHKVFRRLSSRAPHYADKAMKVSRFLRQLKAIKRWSQEREDDLSCITMPTLIVNGDDDRMVPTKTLIFWR